MHDTFDFYLSFAACAQPKSARFVPPGAHKGVSPSPPFAASAIQHPSPPSRLLPVSDVDWCVVGLTPLWGTPSVTRGVCELCVKNGTTIGRKDGYQDQQALLGLLSGWTPRHCLLQHSSGKTFGRKSGLDNHLYGQMPFLRTAAEGNALVSTLTAAQVYAVVTGSLSCQEDYQAWFNMPRFCVQSEQICSMVLPATRKHIPAQSVWRPSCPPVP